MEIIKYKTALIVGAGEGLSASLARLFTREGIRVALAARQTGKLAALCLGRARLRRAGRCRLQRKRATHARGICGSDPCRCCESYRR